MHFPNFSFEYPFECIAFKMFIVRYIVSLEEKKQKEYKVFIAMDIFYVLKAVVASNGICIRI